MNKLDLTHMNYIKWKQKMASLILAPLNFTKFDFGPPCHVAGVVGVPRKTSPDTWTWLSPARTNFKL